MYAYIHTCPYKVQPVVIKTEIDTQTDIDTITVASIPSITSSTLALESLALQWDTLGRGVTVVVSSVAGVDQLRPYRLSYREEERDYMT